MIYEDLPTTPRAEELVDTAFSRAARAGRAKQGREAQESMLRTACNVVADNCDNVVRSWPDFRTVEPFAYEVADAVLRRTTDTRRAGDGEQAGLDALRASLSEVSWAARQTRSIRDETMSKVYQSDTDTARKHRKQAFARVADVVDEVAVDLRRVGAARDALKDLPEIDPDQPTVAVAGYPNVGKSGFVNRVTRASNETAAYPFTTRAVGVGHVDRDHVRYQVVDTPGVLDRPAAERNDIERQAESAVRHLADVVLFLVDASESCGYPLSAQLRLRDELRERFDAPVLTVRNKTDRADESERATTVDADAAMSVETGAGVEAALDRALDAAPHDPEIPPSRAE